MKTKILLLDESVTVQKVVALTLDKNRYSIEYAKTRTEAKRFVSSGTIQLVLVSEQVSDLDVTTFPSEVSTWATGNKPILILITTQDNHSVPGYDAVLRKPFSPQKLQELVAQYAKPETAPRRSPNDGFETTALESAFNKTFNDEEELVRVTLDEAHQSAHETPRHAAESWTTAPASNTTQSLWRGGNDEPPYQTPVFPTPQPRPEPPASGAALWQTAPTHRPAPSPPAPQPQPPTYTAPPAPTPSPAPTPQSATPNEEELRRQIDAVLAKIVPPIVERMVKERLDQLLADSGTKDPLADLKS